ncbi:Gag protein, partial [Phytophthora palmivora]
MDGLKVGPSHTPLFRVHANTMEEAIQIALQEEYNHRQARTPASTTMRQAQCKELQQLELAPGRYPWNWGSIRCYRSGKFGHMQRTCPAGGQRKFPSKPRGSRGQWQKPRPKCQGNWSHQGYGDPFRVLIDSGASTNFARRQAVARNGDKYADALRESKSRGQISVRLADGTVVNVPRTESFLVLDMDKYDLILGMPWLEKHEPWIDWRGKAIGASWPAVPDRALVNNVPTSVRDWGARDGRQGAYAPEEVLGVTDPSEDVAVSLATGRETKAHCQACEIAFTASPNAGSRRIVWASTVAVLDGTVQAGNIGPQAAEAAEESAESASGVSNTVPGKVEKTERKNESAVCVSSVGNVVPREVKKTNTRAEVSLSTSRVDNQVPHSESETPPARPVEEQYHVFDG